MKEKVSDLRLGQRGPHTAEQRAAHSAQKKDDWKANRRKRLTEINAGRPMNSIRRLRLKLEMSQADFAEAIGHKRGNAMRVSNYENGLQPTPEIITRMQKLADERGVKWKYSK